MFVQSQLIYVSLAHRYWNTLWTLNENRKVYGDSASVEGLGSNLKVVLSRTTLVDKELDFREGLGRLKTLADHRCLFTDFTEFGSMASTLERMTLWMARELNQPEADDWAFLEVYETEHLACRIEAGSSQMDLIQKVGNLTLKIRGVADEATGLILSRNILPEAVKEVFPLFEGPAGDEAEWMDQLFGALRERVPQLSSVVVDLGRQKSWRKGDS